MTKHSVQIVVRKIEEGVKRKLQRRAAEHGQSMEAEVRDILRDAVKEESRSGKRLGTRIAERFKELGLTEKDFPKLGVKLRIPKFD